MVKFYDVRTLRKIEKFVIYYKSLNFDSTQQRMLFLKNQFPMYNEFHLISLHNIIINTNIFSRDNSTDIFLKNIDFNKLAA